MKRRKRLWVMIGGLAVVPAFFGIANARVLRAGDGRIFTSSAEIPHHRVGIVLGCAPSVNGGANPFFQGRMLAAAKLYKAGKVDRLLASGDHGSPFYDEPDAMEQALVKLGVPKNRITCDYAGFRTLDSMVRATKVFGLKDATIITDDFHMARALYYADGAGLKADGYASSATENSMTRSTEIREILARGRAVLDETFGAKPKLLGKKESIQ